MDIELIDINDETKFDEFTCEDSLLNDFLKRNAYWEHIMHISRTKIIKVDNKIAGYFTMEFREVEIPIDGDDNKYPAVVLKCLAIDEKFENRGIGTYVLEYITINAKDISEFIGCRCLFLNARIEKWQWYKNRGFQFVDEEFELGNNEEKFNFLEPTIEMFIDFRDSSEIQKWIC